MSTRALIYPADTRDFQPALTLDSSFTYPKERNGAPVTYWWKQMLKPGVRVRNKITGATEEVTPQRINTIAQCYAKAKQKMNFEPGVPLGSHNVKEAKNVGWMVDAQVRPDGSFWGLHQIIGTEDEGRRLAASYKSSISTIENYVDPDTGEVYEELPDHNALVSNPFLTNISDFVPAIAASRGAAVSVVELEPAAPPSKEIQMDFAKLRKRLGAANDVPDEKLIELADQRLGELDTAHQTATQQAATLTQEKTQLSRDLEDARKAKPATKAPPSAAELHYLGRTLALSRDDAAKAAGSECVNAAAKRFLNVESVDKFDTGGLTLSREPADDDATRADGMRKFIDFCELAKLAKPGPGANTPVKGALQLDRTTEGDGQQTPEQVQAAVDASLALTETGRRILAERKAAVAAK